MQRLATERWPYGVVVAQDGTVYVSAWGGSTVSVFTRAESGPLAAAARIRVGRHPSAMLLGADDSRLFVASASTDRIAVVDTKQRRVLTEIFDSPPGGPGEGSTPSALALSAGRHSPVRRGVRQQRRSRCRPRSGHLRRRDGDGRGPDLGPRADAMVSHGGDRTRGHAARAHRQGTRHRRRTANGQRPGRERADAGFDVRQYTLGQTSGALVTSLLARAAGPELAALSARVAHANLWGEVAPAAKLPPFEHVIYIIKENRTYDQLFGDLPQADGDTSLVFFPTCRVRRIIMRSPNASASSTGSS